MVRGIVCMMNVERNWKLFFAGLTAVLVAMACVRAALVDLDAYVDFAILDNNGTPLADGSWVYIIGSGDATNDGMYNVGTNLIGASVLNDDVILGVVQIGTDVNSNGTFFTTVQYDSDDVEYVYLRFFDTTGALTGLIYWGTSTVFELGVTLGVSTVQFDPAGSLQATNLNNFVVIPEPSTANLFVLVAGMLWAMRAGIRKKARKQQLQQVDLGGDSAS